MRVNSTVAVPLGSGKLNVPSPAVIVYASSESAASSDLQVTYATPSPVLASATVPLTVRIEGCGKAATVTVRANRTASSRIGMDVA